MIASCKYGNARILAKVITLFLTFLSFFSLNQQLHLGNSIDRLEITVYF